MFTRHICISNRDVVARPLSKKLVSINKSINQKVCLFACNFEISSINQTISINFGMMKTNLNDLSIFRCDLNYLRNLILTNQIRNKIGQ